MCKRFLLTFFTVLGERFVAVDSVGLRRQLTLAEHSHKESSLSVCPPLPFFVVVNLRFYSSSLAIAFHPTSRFVIFMCLAAFVRIKTEMEPKSIGKKNKIRMTM